MYDNIITPTPKFASHQIIYRIGTFLKYFIFQNNTRLLEDNLLTQFDDYFFVEGNPDASVKRMKDIGLDYIIIDLNAATIDDDPRHDLTRRYENLLKTLPSEKMELVSTDSLCLQLALANYKQDGDIQNYLLTAGVNYQGYTSDGGTVSRSQKLGLCYGAIAKILRDDSIDLNTQYTFLRPLELYLARNNLDRDSDTVLSSLFQQFGAGYKAVFKIQ